MHVSVTTRSLIRTLTLTALVSPAALLAQASSAVPSTPDAQVEANVLKALASNQQLADQRITTTTVYGTVTLTGVVKDEPTRVLAETLASRAQGVQKVVDELTLATDPPAPAAQPAGTGSQSPQPLSVPPLAPSQSAAQPQPVPQQATAPRPATIERSAPGNYAAGQQAGMAVTIPSGALVRVRINEGIDTRHGQPGTLFDGIVLNDVVANGAVAIPRGAAVQGTVVDVKSSGAISGRAHLALQLTQVTLGGQVYPVVSDQWTHESADKSGQTVSSAVGLGAMGAIIGAIAGGGPGAAIGAVAGGAAGVGASAATSRNNTYVPAEAILTFHLTQPAPVVTVSQAEMDRLAHSVAPAGQPMQRRQPPPPYFYPHPVFYPAPY